MSKRKQAAKRFAKETLDAGYQYKSKGDNTFSLEDTAGRQYKVNDAGLDANKTNIGNLFASDRRQRILNSRALAREAALRGATKAPAYVPPTPLPKKGKDGTNGTDGKGGSGGAGGSGGKGGKGGSGGGSGSTPQPRTDMAPIAGKSGVIGGGYENPTLNLTAGPAGQPQKFEDISNIELGQHGDKRVNVPLYDQATPENQYMYVDKGDTQFDKVDYGYPGLGGAPQWYKDINYKKLDLNTMSDDDMAKMYVSRQMGREMSPEEYKKWLNTPMKDGRLPYDAFQNKDVLAKMRNELIQAKTDYETPRPVLAGEHENFDQFRNTGWTFNMLTGYKDGLEIPAKSGTKTPEGLEIVKNPNFQPLYIANTGDREADYAKAVALNKKYNMQGKWYQTKDGKGIMFDPEGAYAGARTLGSISTFFPEIYDAGSLLGGIGTLRNATAAAKVAGRAGENVAIGFGKGLGKGIGKSAVGQGVKQFARRTGTSAARQAGPNASLVGNVIKGTYGGAKGAVSSVARGVGKGVWNTGKGLLSETGGTIGNIYKGNFAKNVAANTGTKGIYTLNDVFSPNYATTPSNYGQTSIARGVNAPWKSTAGEHTPWMIGEHKTITPGQSTSWQIGENAPYTVGQSTPWVRGESRTFVPNGANRPWYPAGESVPYQVGPNKSWVPGQSTPYVQGRSTPYVRGASTPYSVGPNSAITPGVSTPYVQGQSTSWYPAGQSSAFGQSAKWYPGKNVNNFGSLIRGTNLNNSMVYRAFKNGGQLNYVK